MDDLQDWLGRAEERVETLAAAPVQALRATLDHDPAEVGAGQPLRPLWHWLYFLPRPRASAIGPDGHAERGGFLPPVALPRRMWAGSRLEFRAPLCVGSTVRRRARIARIERKHGRNGELVFVTVRHELTPEGAAQPAVVDEHDIVYRAARQPGEREAPPERAAQPAAWRRTLVPDEVLLFRYSALTFNGHRIHYDRRYVTEVEGYPGLVVHGPLTATLLLDLLHRQQPAADVAAFEFRAVRPAFDGRALTLCAAPEPDARSVALWAEDDQGWVTMRARATLR